MWWRWSLNRSISCAEAEPPTRTLRAIVVATVDASDRNLRRDMQTTPHGCLGIVRVRASTGEGGTIRTIGQSVEPLKPKTKGLILWLAYNSPPGKWVTLVSVNHEHEENDIGLARTNALSRASRTLHEFLERDDALHDLLRGDHELPDRSAYRAELEQAARSDFSELRLQKRRRLAEI